MREAILIVCVCVCVCVRILLFSGGRGGGQKVLCHGGVTSKMCLCVCVLGKGKRVEGLDGINKIFRFFSQFRIKPLTAAMAMETLY